MQKRNDFDALGRKNLSAKKPSTDPNWFGREKDSWNNFQAVFWYQKNSWDAKSLKVNVNTVRGFKNTLVL